MAWTRYRGFVLALWRDRASGRAGVAIHDRSGECIAHAAALTDARHHIDQLLAPEA